MSAAKVSDAEIIAAIQQGLTLAQILKQCKFSSPGSMQRIRAVARRNGLTIAINLKARATAEAIAADKKISEFLRPHGRRGINVSDGVVLAFSDAHFWPGIRSTAFRAFVQLAPQFKPCAVIDNGDAVDGAQISRWPRIGWDSRPTVLQELEAVKERKAEIEAVCGTRNLYWNLGNHDARFETFLAAKAPEFQGVNGFHLKDHFPLWLPSWSVWINDGELVVKHRFKGGIHATHNNALWSGKSMVTGHLHSAKVTPLTDYNGTRWGVDLGTLAQPHGPQFEDYTEDNPVNWRSAFGVFTFWRGRLLDPELVRVMDEEAGLVVFRGQVIQV